MADHDDLWSGPATLAVDGRELAVHALLDARHEPHDGRLHWFGRVTLPAGAPELAPNTEVELRTESGRGSGRIGDRDPWNRYRVTGVGSPPCR